MLRTASMDRGRADMIGIGMMMESVSVVVVAAASPEEVVVVEVAVAVVNKAVNRLLRTNRNLVE
ncbi:MAG: hypothetical protein ACREEM_29455 [Blastocatellia bacterium]